MWPSHNNFCLLFVQGNGPLAEIDYWRERNAAVSALYEQLKAPRVQRFMEIYSKIDYSFEYLREDLGTFYAEAKDNVKFLSTLERHFKNVTHGASFQSVCIMMGIASVGVCLSVCTGNLKIADQNLFL